MVFPLHQSPCPIDQNAVNHVYKHQEKQQNNVNDEVTEQRYSTELPIDSHENINILDTPEYWEQFLGDADTFLQNDFEMFDEYGAPIDSSPNTSFTPFIEKVNPISTSYEEPIYQKLEYSTINCLWSTFIQSIMNGMPHLPSDRISDIIEVDFPTDFAMPTFYQLLSQMTLLGPHVFTKCTILRMMSFSEWNRKNSLPDHRPVWNVESNNCADVEIVEPGDVIDELISENLVNSSNISSSSKNLEQKSSPNQQSTTEQFQKQLVSLDVVVQGQYLSPQSEMFSKIFHYMSTQIFFRPHPCGRYASRITMPVPSVSTIEPIIIWMYNHDDEAWLKTVTPRIFEQICQNVIFLGLGDNALEVLYNYFQQHLEEIIQ
ncbi:16516_t:CDS:2 [Gigaspora margarita]|uniref:16516_t:CDS:1 n=1 Tax=Gigaspora margarita TaxID=4874 RepID=A0ABN7VKV0_GIGMA|nr:16516_t:CDS:2 [Gigaspora margarita]